MQKGAQAFNTVERGQKQWQLPRSLRQEIFTDQEGDRVFRPIADGELRAIEFQFLLGPSGSTPNYINPNLVKTGEEWWEEE